VENLSRRGERKIQREGDTKVKKGVLRVEERKKEGRYKQGIVFRGKKGCSEEMAAGPLKGIKTEVVPLAVIQDKKKGMMLHRAFRRKRAGE